MKQILLFVLIITIIKSSLKEYKNEEKTILKTNIFNLDKNYLNLRKLQGSSDSTSDSVSDSTSDSTSDSVSDSVSDSTTSDSTTSDSTTSDSTTSDSTSDSASDSISDSTADSTNSTYSDLKEYILLFFKDAQKDEFIKFLAYLRVVNAARPSFFYLTSSINKSNGRLRSLENTNETIKCDYSKDENNNNNIYEYDCSKNKEGNNIKGNVNLIYLDNILIEGNEGQKADTGPLADYTKTLKNGDIIDKLSFDTPEYEMSDCEITNKDKDLIIRGTLPNNFTPNNPSYLYVVTNNNEFKNITCKYESIKNSDDYKLICNPTSSFQANLDKSFVLNNNSHLILSFNDTKSGNVDFSSSKNENHPYLKRSGGLSTGGIIAIILPCIAALIAVVAITFLLGKKTVPPPIQNLGNNTIGINSSTNAVQ